MKNYFCSLLFVISLFSFSQNISYGISGGINNYSLNGVNAQGSFDVLGSTGIKSNFGLFADYKLNDKMGLVGNIVLQGRGFELTPDIELKYLHFNPLYKFDSNNSYGQGLYFKGGFRYSILMSAKTKEDETDVKDAFKSTNLGIILGAGIDINDYLGVELLADYSPTNIIENSDGGTIKSNMYGFELRLILNIEKLINK